MKRIKEFFKENSALIGIITLGTFFRLYKINYQGLWLDELYTIIPTAPENSIHSLIEYCKIDQPPAFFLFLYGVFHLFPYNEITGRVACAIIGIVSLVVVYFLGKEIKNKEVGLFASFLAAINLFHIYYSQELRFYSMTFMLSSLSFLFLTRAYKRLRKIDLILYSTSTIILVYTHYYGLLIFAVQVLIFSFLVVREKKYHLVPIGILVGGLVCVSFLPWIPILRGDLKINDFWIAYPKVFFVAEYFYDYTGKDIGTTLIILWLTVHFVKFLISEKSKSIFLIIIGWIVLSYVIPYLWSIYKLPILHNRYTIVTLPAWFLVFSLGWENLKNTRLKYAVPIGLFVSLLINLSFFNKYYSRITKDQYRESSQFVIENNREGYPIYAPNPFYWHFNYYFRNQTNRVASIDERKNSGKCWLLQSHFSDQEREAFLKALENEYLILEKHSFYKADAVLLQHK